jgi:lysophospholipase L1-like esterase
MTKRLRLLALTLIVSAPAVIHAAVVAPTDPLVRYVGRFDTTDLAGPRCSWSASTIAFTVSGGSVNVRMKDRGRNFWQVVVDGQPTAVLDLEPGEKDYPIATDLPPGKHTIELVKRTEAQMGVSQFRGLQIDDSARLLPTPARPHRIEVIGDSISCGYGNEAPNKETHFSPDTENAWLAYGAVAARALQADYVCIAWSGKKLWPDNTLVSIYDQVAPTSLPAKWDFTRWTPDVVVVNLATNDFNGANPDETGWVAAYVKFIGEIRSHYPKAPIYCAVGSMMSDWPPEQKPRTVLLGYLKKVVAQANATGGPAVRMVDLGIQKPENGIGADWHPSAKTHALMADILATTIKQDLGW